MDLESFEADLADYSLQETPFYDSVTVCDYSMSKFQHKLIVMKSSEDGIAKRIKPRKTVTFLPNYVQVCVNFFKHDMVKLISTLYIIKK